MFVIDLRRQIIKVFPTVLSPSVDWPYFYFSHANFGHNLGIDEISIVNQLRSQRHFGKPSQNPLKNADFDDVIATI